MMSTNSTEGEISKRLDETLNTPDLIKLYDIASSSYQNYGRIIWQLPTAIISLNVLAVKWLTPGTSETCGLATLNFVFLFVFWRHVRNQQTLQEHLVLLETRIFQQEVVETRRKTKNLIPTWSHPGFRSTSIMLVFLTIASLAFAGKMFRLFFVG